MATAFISQVSQEKLPQIELILQSMPGYISSQTVAGNLGSQVSRTIFCRLYDGTFEIFKIALTSQYQWDPSFTIEEGHKVGEKIS